jgi:hypothetical protein
MAGRRRREDTLPAFGGVLRSKGADVIFDDTLRDARTLSDAFGIAHPPERPREYRRLTVVKERLRRARAIMTVRVASLSTYSLRGPEERSVAR